MTIANGLSTFKDATYWKSQGKLGKGFGVAYTTDAQKLEQYVAQLDAGNLDAPLPTMETKHGAGLVAMLSAAAKKDPTPTPPPDPTPTPGDLPVVFSSDPAKGDLKPWDRFNAGSGDIDVNVEPNGRTSPGIVRVAADPLGKFPKAYELTTTPTAHASPAAGTQSVYLWQMIEEYFGKVDHTNEMEFWTLFSHWVNPGPTVGGLNWFFEGHNGGGMASPDSTNVFGILTDHRVSDGSIQPQLFARFSGGYTSNPEPDLYVFSNKPLPQTAWLKHKIRITWSPEKTKGRVSWEVLLNGTDPFFSCDYQRATLWADGKGNYDRPNFEYVNYHPILAVNSSIFFSGLTVRGD